MADPKFALQVELSNLAAYSVTKAAANMAIRKYGAALKTLGSPVILLNVYPGTFQNHLDCLSVYLLTNSQLAPSLFSFLYPDPDPD